MFNPFQHEESNAIDSALNDFHLNKLNCNYYFSDSDVWTQYKNNFNLMSFNISSIPLHLEAFSDQCLDTLGITFDVIGFCETRLNGEICNLYSLSGYTAYFKNKNTSGGGVAIYIDNRFQGYIYENISLLQTHIESLFIRLVKPLNCIVGMIYRPPNSNTDDFLASLEDILQFISAMNIPCYIMGDFNINLLKVSNHMQVFINLLFAYYFSTTITKPTRVTTHSATLIDHIWTNNFEYYRASGILYSSLSDHFPIFSSFNVDFHNCNSFQVRKRIISESSISTFKADISQLSLNFGNSNNVDEDFNIYMDAFQGLYNHNFPVKIYEIKGKHVGKPYITPAIVKSIRQKDKLQRLYAKWPITYEQQFKKYRNSLTSVIKAAKKNYMNSRLNENTSNPRKMWEVINGVLGRKESKTEISFSHNNKIITDKTEIANVFNNYFCNVATDLIQGIQQAPTSFENYLPDPVIHSFSLAPTSLTEVTTVIKDLKVASPGHDDVDIKVIKECVNEVSPYLVHIINKSFSSGIFPKQLKIARVIPIFKTGDKSSLKNYRPISILPTFSKIIEKIVARRLINYLNQHCLLSDSQYGFRPNFSTELAIFKLCQNIYNAVDDKQFQLTLFCDFSKAFDTISHSILLQKLSVYGVRGKELDWFASYLNDRQQFTVYNGVSSSCRRVEHGVPQGSVLGPLLFLLFINDVTTCSDRLKFILFADDTTIIFQGRDIISMQNTVNEELVKLSNWIKSNKLILNHSKTHYMISTPHIKLVHNVDIILDNVSLTKVNEAKFLGMIVDCQLNFRSHINDVKLKISKLTGVIFKIRDFMTLNALRLIYFSLIYPYFIYGAAIWGGGYETDLDSLFLSQKKIVRIITCSSRFAHTTPLFRNLKLLKLNDIIKLQTSIFVYNALNVFSSNCGLQYVAQHVLSRRPGTLRVPLCRTSFAQRSITYRGTSYWNDLPHNIRTSTSLNTFKLRLKCSLAGNYM